ncbi:CAP-Gly domain-containing linker protein 1-like [Metopolophium dirhodum]|uniref:CAP-Gly domain-containing linker protein 1-like n=1 Tax=Metopolophium dirhodum TaxID=44670 RepID=UPI00298FE0FA|nr:CAP-Gly domain-containing linker protein 1-like [Metopolophium dirhodum]
MESIVNYMANTLKKILKEKSNLENRLQQVTEELCSKTKDHAELVKICNDECISREVCEKKKTLKNNITIIDGLEYGLCDMKDQLIETEKLKIICQDKCKHLSIQNEELNNKLEIKNYNNIKNCHKIENLCKRIIQFEAVTKGLEMQNKTHIVEIDELKEEKCVAEKKFNKIIEDLYCTIQELRNELATAKLDIENTKKCLENINDEDKKSFEHKIGLLKTDIGNLETELDFYKCQYDSLMTKNLLNEKELSKFNEMVQRLQTREFELNKENEENKEHVSTLCINVNMIKQQLEETIQKNNELTHHNDNLRAENDVQCQDIDELNNTLITVRKNESCVRKDLVVHKEKLTKADEEIANLNSEMSHVKCEFHKTCAKLTCTEQKLHNTECKLNEEICLKKEITEKYCNMVNCLTTNCDMKQSIKPTCISAGCQYDISVDDKQIGDYCCFPGENNISCNITNYDVRGLNYENTYSIEMTKESTHIGIQTNLCCPETVTPVAHCGTVSVIMDESCPNDNVKCCPEPCDTNKCDFGQCESNDSCTCQCETPPLETTSQLDCHSADCSRSEKSELTTSCDCIAVFLEKENLKCQLAESTQLLEQYGKDTEKKICEIQAEHCKKEFDMNECFNKKTSQYKKDIDELTTQLEDCKATILCMEKELTCCLERENRLKKDIEKLKQAIKCKDSKINDEENKMKTMCECLEECKKQFVTLKCSLELEKSTKEELDKQLEQKVVKPKKKIIKKLKTPEKVVRKNKVPKNIKKNVYDPCGDKRLRSGADHDTGHKFRGTEQEMYSRHRARRFNGYTRDDSHYYPDQVRSNPRGLGYGDPAAHTLPPQFVESLRQQVRKNVGCDNTNCYVMGCCSKLYFRH